jgi:hypothetical protein
LFTAHVLGLQPSRHFIALGATTQKKHFSQGEQQIEIKLDITGKKNFGTCKISKITFEYNAHKI